MSPPKRQLTRHTFQPILPAPKQSTSSQTQACTIVPTVTPLLDVQLSASTRLNSLHQQIPTPTTLPYYPYQHPNIYDNQQYSTPITTNSFLPFISHQTHCPCFLDPLLISLQILFNHLYNKKVKINHVVLFTTGDAAALDQTALSTLLHTLHNHTHIPISVAQPTTDEPNPQNTQSPPQFK